MQALPSVMDHSFSRVPEALIQRSSFDRSHGHKTTFDTGYLVPFYVDEALPGDTFNLNATILARLSSNALQRPIMDNLFIETFWFACPYRLVWSNFVKFMGELEPGVTTTYTIPQLPTPVTGVVSGSLSDHFGIPVGVAAIFNVNSLFHRMYNLTWNQWFRDENMQASVTVDLDDGPDTYNDYVLLRRGKRHDYFTSCLTAPQKGTAVPLPLGTEAPVLGIFKNTNVYQAGPLTGAFETGGGTATVAPNAGYQVINPAAADTEFYIQRAGSTDFPYIRADLTNATASTINSLRQAIALQQYMEVNARGGTRYTEIVRSHFGVISPDARLQRVEFLGSGQTSINVNPVAGTNNVGTGATAAGQLTAFATASGSGHGFTKSFTEHSLVMGLACVRADLTYQQGLNKMFSRRTKYDLYWPTFAGLGEQAVLQGEIFTDGVNDSTVFGYQERYAEYRYKPSEITGVFRSNCSAGVTSLEVFHLSQDFAAAPTLTNDFIVENPPVSRTLAVATSASSPEILFDSYIRLHCARPMPMYGVPGLYRL